MKSMTGFGAIEFANENLKLSVRIRSVNARFLELRTQLPPEYQGFESEIKKKLAGSLGRGTVDLYVSKKNHGSKSSVKVQADTALAKEWLKAYQTLARSLKLPEQVEMQQLVRVPHILQMEEEAKPKREEKELLFQQIDKALEICTKEKLREGAATKKDLGHLLKALEAYVIKIEKEKELANKDLEKRFYLRLEKHLKEVEIDYQRLAHELGIQMDKLDITEEVLRLREHVLRVKELLLERDAPVGKRLDFYTQELLREINTIGSKCQNSQITKFVVESKGLIERFREIVQNIE